MENRKENSTFVSAMIQPTQKAQRGDEYLEVYFVSTPIPIRYLISARVLLSLCVVVWCCTCPAIGAHIHTNGWMENNYCARSSIEIPMKLSFVIGSCCDFLIKLSLVSTDLWCDFIRRDRLDSCRTGLRWLGAITGPSAILHWNLHPDWNVDCRYGHVIPWLLQCSHGELNDSVGGE